MLETAYLLQIRLYASKLLLSLSAVFLLIAINASTANATTTLSVVALSPPGSGNYMLVINAADGKENKLRIKNLNPVTFDGDSDLGIPAQPPSFNFSIVDEGDEISPSGANLSSVPVTVGKIDQKICNNFISYHRLECNPAGLWGFHRLRKIAINAKDKNDSVVIERYKGPLPTVNDGCAVNLAGIVSPIPVGFGIPVSISGGSGNDYLSGGCASDYLSGGLGSDILIGNGDGYKKDTLSCGVGSDRHQKDDKDTASGCEKLF